VTTQPSVSPKQRVVHQSTLRALGSLGLHLTEQEIGDFARVMHQVTGVEISPERAAESASALVLFARALFEEAAAEQKLVTSKGRHA
jgi:hypothetical protein